MSDKVIKSFEFHVPVDISKSEDEQWRIQGIASTADEDLQGEVVDQSGLDISLLKAGRGLFNHDHQKGPENVLGQIEEADFVDVDGKKCLFVKGYLFKEQDRAKAYYNIMKSIKKGSTHRVHFSIEGKILQRDFTDPKKIVKARIDKVALTMDPVNPVTYATFAKSLEAMQENPEGGESTEINDQTGEVITISKELADKIHEVSKAIMAGASVGAPTSMTGGEALKKECLDKDIKNVTHKKKKITKSMIELTVRKVKEQFPDISNEELIDMVSDSFTKYIKE